MNRMLTLPDLVIKEESEKLTAQTNKQIAEFCQWFLGLIGSGVLYIKVFFGGTPYWRMMMMMMILYWVLTVC